MLLPSSPQPQPQRACPATRPAVAQAISPFIDQVTKEKVAFVSSKDYQHLLGEQQQEGGTAAAAAAAAAASPAESGRDASGFARYLPFYSLPYDKAQYLERLRGLGW